MCQSLYLICLSWWKVWNTIKFFVLFLFYFILLFFCLVDENTKHFLILLRVCGKKCCTDPYLHGKGSSNQYACMWMSVGTAEPCTLCWPEQPNKAAWHLPAVDGAHYARVLPPGRPGARTGHGHQPNVRPTHRFCWEITGTVSDTVDVITDTYDVFLAIRTKTLLCSLV